MNQMEALEMRIAHLLRWGVLAAGALLATGWVSQIRWSGNPFVEFHDYAPVPLKDSYTHLLDSPTAWITYSGLLLLVSLPLIRVLFTAVLFWRQGDRILSIAAALVSITLIASCVLGLEL